MAKKSKKVDNSKKVSDELGEKLNTWIKEYKLLVITGEALADKEYMLNFTVALWAKRNHRDISMLPESNLPLSKNLVKNTLSANFSNNIIVTHSVDFMKALQIRLLTKEMWKKGEYKILPLNPKDVMFAELTAINTLEPKIEGSVLDFSSYVKLNTELKELFKRVA